MKKKTTIETRVEMQEVWIIVKPRHPSTVLCEVCAGQQTAMLTPQAAAKLAGVSMRTLFRWVEGCQVHFLEQADGRLWVCPNSLPGEVATVAARTLRPSRE